jgi:16S rRNA G966 N2-methylase RsmD
VELDRDHHRFITDCLQKLGIATSLRVTPPVLSSSPQAPQSGTCLPIRGDVFRFLKSCRQQFDFIFADPPYALRELPQIPDLILRDGDRQLLKEGGVFVFEHGSNYDFSGHPRFQEHRSYGSVNFTIFR